MSLVERRREEREAFVDGLLGAARQRLREAGVRAEVQGRLRENYLGLTREKSGDLAVAGARSFGALKSASSPNVAIQSGSAESAAPAGLPAATPAMPAPVTAALTR